MKVILLLLLLLVIIIIYCLLLLLLLLFYPSELTGRRFFSVLQESPQKPSQDQALAAAAAAAAAGSSLMSPLAFQSSGKVTIMTPPSQTKQPAPKMEIAPLTEEQLVQAMTYLLKVHVEAQRVVLHAVSPKYPTGIKWLNWQSTCNTFTITF